LTLRSSSLCSFLQPSKISFLLGPNTLFNTIITHKTITWKIGCKRENIHIVHKVHRLSVLAKED
jgi:hypothetical protein